MRQKIRHLILEVVGAKRGYKTTTSIVVPKELPSVEEALKKLAATMKALETTGLSKTEVTRLRRLIQATGAYQVRFAEYVNYRGLEKRLVELEEKGVGRNMGKQGCVPWDRQRSQISWNAKRNHLPTRSSQ